MTVAERCRRPGCAGSIDDGFCDDCGLAPTSPGHSATQVNGVPAAAPSTRESRPRGTATISHGRLGHGLVEIPPVPSRDPEAAVMSDPTVAEHRRFCASCDEPVGRSRDGLPGRTEGFCRACGAPFSFLASLAPGALVAGQYEVVGCLAHGGLGWIYLARDHFVSERWVVLKGLLNARDEHAMAAALAERQFLAEVEHPNIVKIHNFVEHHGDGYIVMEFVDGVSLKEMLDARRRANGGRPDPLPVEQAIAFCLEILPALAHLHELGLVFCDFKPDNVIQSRGAVKLIDLGGVYRMDDRASPVYGTVGFQAPEVAHTGPTVTSDLFTVGRTLAVLASDFAGYQSTFRYTLPPASAVPLYAVAPSLYAFLERATAPDPDDRFQSAEEMGAQLLGVLREIVAAGGTTLPPTPSTRFAPPARGSLEGPDWRALPTPLVNPDDPAAAVILSLPDADEVVRRLGPQQGQSVETDLWLARALIQCDRAADALALLDGVAGADPWEWRATWYRGLAAVATGDADQARASFNGTSRALPGELAPKLALAMTEETAGDPARAAGWYEVVARTDPTFTTASFGLARCRTALGDRDGAIAAYGRVLDTSSAHADALMAQAALLLNGVGPDPLQDVARAGALIEQVPTDRERRGLLAAQVLERALAAVRDGAGGGSTVLGVRLAEGDLRLALERTYRGLARKAATDAERIALVDRANAVRPRTWW